MIPAEDTILVSRRAGLRVPWRGWPEMERRAWPALPGSIEGRTGKQVCHRWCENPFSHLNAIRPIQRTSPGALILALLIAIALTLTGCSDRTDRPENGAEPAVVRTAGDGPVSIKLSLSTESLLVGETARVVLEVQAPPGVTVEVENYRRALLDGDRRFELDVSELSKEEALPIDAGKLIWRYGYDVSPLLPGQVELPSAVVRYIDTRTDAQPDNASGPDATVPTSDAYHEVRTDPIVVTVSDSAAAALSEADLHEIQILDPRELERPLNHWAWLIALGAVMLLALFALAWRRRRRATEQRDVAIPAHEWAWSQIARLVADDLIGKGRVQEFYYRISAIVRGYIERRFGVSAPEMTTEEFLQASARDPRFSVEHRDGVGRFLEACDLVKYARYIPSDDQADELLAAARAFIEKTREHSTMEERHAPTAHASQERAA